MPLVLLDRVRETTAVTGTSDAVLLGAVTGFQAFSAVGNGNTCYYTIADQSGGNWEVGIGTYSTTGPTLQRTTILSSSAGGAKVSFAAGTKDVFVTYPSEKAVYLDESDNVQPNLGNAVATQLNITAQGDLRLEDSAGGQYVAIHAPATVTTSYTLTLPVDDGTNGQALITDGNGNLSWSTAASGDVYGPASSTLNAIPTFADTTGKLLQNNTGVTISSNTVTASGGFSTAANLTFTGTGNRITGDFSNSTITSRVLFQTSTANVATSVGAVPNGTSSFANFSAYNTSDPTNSSRIQIATTASDVRVASDILGTGTYLPLTMYTGGSERLRIDTSGNVGIATSSPSSFGKFAVQGASTNRVFYADSLAQPVARYDDNSFIINGLTIRNSGITGSNQGIGLLFQLGVSGTPVTAGVIQMRSEGDFSSAATQDAAMTFGTVLDGTATERLRIDSGGNVGIGTSSPVAFSGYTTLQVNNSVNGGMLLLTNGTQTYWNYVNSAGGLLGMSSNHPLIFQTNNSERMRITAAGDVGIGTASPAARFQSTLNTNNGTIGVAAILDAGTQNPSVSGGGIVMNFRTNSGTSFFGGVGGYTDGTNYVTGLWGGAAASGAPGLNVSSSGNVGIGIIAPGSKLQVVGDIVASSTTTLPVILAASDQAAGYAPPNIQMRRRGAGGTTTPDFQGIGQIRFDGASVGNVYDNMALIEVQCGVNASGGAPSSMLFYTASSGANATERMRIDSAGNIAVGTSTALAKLFSAGATGQAGIIGFAGNANGNYPSDTFGGYIGYNFSAGGAEVDFWNSWTGAPSASAGFAFRKQTGASSNNVLFYIRGDGDVAIGTTSASGKLKVYQGSSADCNINFEAGVANYATNVSLLGNNAGGSRFNNIRSAFGSTEQWYVGGLGIDSTLGFKTGGTERMRIDSSGNVGIATGTTTRARLNIVTDGTNTSAGYGVALTNAAGGGSTWTLQCGDFAVNNGAFTIRETGISGTTWFKIESTTGYVTAQGIYNLTTGSAANVFVGTGGDLRRSTSSLKYKRDIKNATHGLAEVLKLRPVTYKGKSVGDGDTVFGGLIAEEVDAIGLTEFVQYAEDGSPDALAYGNMVSLLVKAIQEQQAMIEELKQEVALLKGV